MTKEAASILVIDDDEDVLTTARIFLKQNFIKVETQKDPKSIDVLLPSQDFDVVLLDMNFRKGFNDGKEGLYWLNRILEIKPNTVIILMTAYGDVELAVKAIKKGAVDFVLKPWSNEKFLATIYSALKLSKSKKEVTELKSRQTQISQLTSSENQFIGESQSVKQMFELIDKVSQTDANILIGGENGTGKEIIANIIHKKSNRNNEVFVRVDMGSLNENIFESEIFGHVKGAFTDAKEDKPGRFEIANGGTIFLDEIGNLSPTMQAKLLTVIQSQKISRVGSNKEIKLNVRLICATNSNLPQMVDDELFREDLLYRINTVELAIPPLRERRDDIVELVNFFVDLYCKKYNKSNLSISKSALETLYKYNWPGNVRELQHTIERAVILCSSPTIQSDDLNLTKKTKLKKGIDESLSLEEMEKLMVEKALERNKGNISKASQDLGLTRAALYRRMEKYGI